MPKKPTPQREQIGFAQLPIGRIIDPKPRKAAYKKPESVKMLERMWADDHAAKHPDLPKWGKQFRDDTANKLTDCIVQYITLRGGFASRINNQGTYSAKLGRYIPSTSRKGLADVMATLKGKSISVEVKVGKDIMSESQRKVQEETNRAGGHYFVARDFTSFVEWVEGL